MRATFRHGHPLTGRGKGHPFVCFISGFWLFRRGNTREREEGGIWD
jgi:hypothetical protein